MKHRFPTGRVAALVLCVAAAGAIVGAQQKTYPYPTTRDLGATIPPGPRPLPTPPLVSFALRLARLSQPEPPLKCQARKVACRLVHGVAPFAKLKRR